MKGYLTEIESINEQLVFHEPAVYGNDAVGEEIADAVKKLSPQAAWLKPSCGDWKSAASFNEIVFGGA